MKGHILRIELPFETALNQNEIDKIKNKKTQLQLKLHSHKIGKKYLRIEKKIYQHK